jgi:predicted nuclease of predicted toxin-antitoxin system
MRVVLDENLPVELKAVLTGHEVHTIADLGWKGISNGHLLARTGEESFGVLVTMDRGFAFQQNLQTLPVAVLLIRAASNDTDMIMPLVPDILKALSSLPPRKLTWVPSPPPTSTPAPAST